MKKLLPCVAFFLMAWTSSAGLVVDPFSRFVQPDHHFDFETDGMATLGGVNFTAGGDLPTTAPGVDGNGQDADGNGDTYTAADDLFEMTGENPKTISGWFKRPAGEIGTLMGAGDDSGDPSWRIRTNELNAIRFQSSADGAAGFESNVEVATGIGDQVWFHVALVHDPVADEIRIHIDGALEHTASVSGGLDDPADKSNVFWDGTADELDGQADEIAVWDRVLTAGEIDRLYHADEGRFFTRNHFPSGSGWVSGAPDESGVYDATLASWMANDPSRSWEMRIGKGGQVYSLITAAGETVPPQAQVAGWDPSWWQDEVWQGVAVDTGDPESDWFLHGSGPYAEPPVYNLSIATEYHAARHAYRVVHRMSQATNPDQPNHAVLETRYRDAGIPGVIEVTQRFFNFGPDLDFFNTPWGGVRKSTLGHHFTTNKAGKWTLNAAVFPAGVLELDQMGGWAAWCDSPRGNSEVLAIVFGHDPKPLDPRQRNQSAWQFGDNGEPARDYLVGTVNRKVTLTAGEGLQSRFFFVVGPNIKAVATTIKSKGLTKAARMRIFKF